MNLFGLTISFQRQEKFLADLGGYTPAVKARAIPSGFAKVVYDGTPQVSDPADVLRGVEYYLWFRPLGWTIKIGRLKVNMNTPWTAAQIAGRKQAQCSGSN